MKKTTRQKKLIFFSFLAIFFLAFVEIFSWGIIKWIRPHYDTARRIMLGEPTYVLQGSKTISQPYLLYIQAPDYVDMNGVKQHNEHGYRGTLVPLQKQENVPRILFMGGSTTYGAGVLNPDESYPSQVKRLLRENHNREIEVINAGLLYGTSAEILTHYLFKYKYYNPDIIVINTGGNDAHAVHVPYYHPDYSHWRKTMHQFQPLPNHSRWLFHSRSISLATITLFYSDKFHMNWFVGKHAPIAPWFTNPETNVSDKWPGNLEIDRLAFAQNIGVLTREILSSKTRLLFVPFRLNPSAKDKTHERAILENEQILKEIASANQVSIAPFPANSISPENWVDNCHLNANGNLEKANHILTFVLEFLTK